LLGYVQQFILFLSLRRTIFFHYIESLFITKNKKKLINNIINNLIYIINL